jgi:putative addiction module component (TIGR02574 family)
MDIDIAKLSPEERLCLLERLWDSLADTPSAVPVTPAQRAELERRLDDLDASGPVGMSWSDVARMARDHLI